MEDKSYKTYHFKVVYGYDKDQYITITQEELPKAYYAFLYGEDDGRVMLADTALRTRDIIRIEPDWHTEEGWNKTHKMDEYDHAHLGSKVDRYRKVQGYGKDIAQLAQRENRPELLSGNFREITRVEKLQCQHDTLTSVLAKKLAIN